MAKKKTIKYLENGEYHDATVKDVGVIEELKTESKDNLVEAINEIFLGGGKGFSDLQQKVDESTQAAQNAQQAAGNLQQRLEEVAQNVGLSDEEARKIINQAVEDAKRAQAEALQAYKDAQKELDDSMAQFMEEQKAINKELEQAKSDIQGDIDQKNAEIEQINAVIESTKSDLTATSARLASVRNDLSNAQMDWGKVRQEITNINGKLDSKMSNTDFDEYKERIERNETEITQTKNELQSKATKQDLDVLTGTVTTQGSSITQLAGKIEQKVSKDTLANDIDDFQVKKANIFTGTREFMGWEFSDKALGRVNDNIYNHAKVAELHNGSNLSITVDGLEIGKTYSVSIFAKASANSNTSGVKVTVDNGKSYSGLMRTVYTPHDTKVTTNWQRYYTTIVASATTMKFVFDRSGMTSDITLYLNRPKLEVGETVYAWEDNAQDIYKRVEHTEAQFDVYNDQISGIVKRQTETDKKIENVSSTFTQRADGIEANAKKYTNDKVTGLTEEFSGRLKATSQELSTEYEKQTNAKIGALSDGGSNLILNSSFLVTDDNGNATLENWRDTSSKVRLTKPNGLDGTWIKVNRATTGTALGARSNYFPVKQGKLVVGVDVALDGSGNISPYVLRIEYYDVSNNRVNYEDITLQKLGLSASQITKSGSNFRYARGVYKTSNDRSDVAKACIVVPETITGYDMYLTNFFAKFSDVNDGTYEVNPLDQQASLIKQRTKIEQDSEKINLLNTQTEKLGNDIKATNTSVNVLKGEVDLKASQSTVNDLTNRVAKNAADIKVFPDKIKSEVSEVSKKIDGVNDKVDNIKVGGTNLLKGTSRDLQQKSTTNDWVRLPYNTDFFRSIYPLDNFTARVWIEKPNKDSWLQAYVGGNGLFKGNVIKAGQSGYSEVHGTLNKDITGANLVIGAGDGVSVSLGWKELKLEKGTIATDWSPAPEDLQEGIDIATTKATQTNTKFERMLNKIQYNDSTGEIGKYEHKITELANGTQEKISAIRLDSDKKLQSATQTLTNKIGDLESTIRTNTTNIGQYRQEMTNSAQGLEVKLTSYQNLVLNDITGMKNKVDNIQVGGTNLLKGTSRDLQQKSTTNDWVRLPYNTDFFRSIYPLDNFTARVWIEKPNKDSWLQAYVGGNGLFKGNVIKAGQSGYSEVHGTLNKDITGANLVIGAGDGLSVSLSWKELKLEKGTIATDWSPAPEDIDNKIEVLSGKITANSNEFSTVYSKITNAKNDAINSIKGDSQWQSMGKIVTNAAFLQNSDGFAQEVVRTATPMVNGGGKNLARGTSDSWQGVGTQEFNGGTNFTKQVADVYLDDLNVGDKATVQIIYQYSGVTTSNAQCWLQGEGNVTSWNSGNFYGTPITMQTGTDVKKGSFKYTFDITSDAKKNRFWRLAWRFDNVNKGAWFQWLRFKVEKGTVATPWSPAPEDLATKLQLNDISSRTQFLQDDEKFLLRVTKAGGATKSDINSVNSKIGNLQGQITVNANKFNTVFTKVTDVDNKINPLNERTEFLQDNSQFLLRVQQAGAATGGVNNLLTNSDTFDGYSENNTNSFDFQKIEGSGLPSVPNQPSITMMGHVWDNYGSAYNKNDGIYLEKGETYWFGVYLMTDSNAGAFRNLSVYASSDKGQTSGGSNKSYADEAIGFNKHFGGKTKTWKWNTFKLTGDGTTRYNWRIEPYNHIGGSIWTAGYMLVKSPLPPTGWSPNMTDVQMRLDSGGVTINGNTTINGELNTQDVVLKGKSSTMALNGDGGVGIFDNSGKFGMRLTGAKLNFDLKFNNELEKLGGIIATKNSASNNVNGMHLYVTPLQALGKPYGGDEIGIGKQTALSGSGNIQSAMVYNATGVSKEEGFHWYKPSYLETTEGRTIKVVGARDPLIWRALKWGASTQGDYYQPFLSLGYNDNTVGDSGIGFYWNSVKLAGSVDMSDARIWMKDAEANIRFGWTSWSDWTGKIPSMYRTEWGKTQSTGGIGFGGDGNVILFGGGRRWDMNHH